MLRIRKFSVALKRCLLQQNIRQDFHFSGNKLFIIELLVKMVKCGCFPHSQGQESDAAERLAGPK